MSKPFIGRLDPPNYDYYLGDGVYATFDGFQVWIELRADMGSITLTNKSFKSVTAYKTRDLRIAMCRETIEQLVAYEQAAQRQYKSPTS